MKKDERAEAAKGERWVRRFLVMALSVVLFGSLYAGIRMLD